MKKLFLLLALVVGLGFFATPKAEAFTSFGISIGGGYPYGGYAPYGYGYAPYGYAPYGGYPYYGGGYSVYYGGGPRYYRGSRAYRGRPYYGNYRSRSVYQGRTVVRRVRR